MMLFVPLLSLAVESAAVETREKTLLTRATMTVVIAAFATAAPVKVTWHYLFEERMLLLLLLLLMGFG